MNIRNNIIYLCVNIVRLVHKIISEDQTPEYHYIFAVESPINTLKQIIAVSIFDYIN